METTELVQGLEMEQTRGRRSMLNDPSDSRLLISHLYPHHHPPSSSGSRNRSASVSNRMKRRSISPSSLLSSLQGPEPKFKKLFLDKDENVSASGYSKISIPCSFGACPSSSSRPGNPTLTHMVPPLRRTVSDPYNAIAIINGENTEEGPVSKSALPRQPQSLRRTMSNPNPSPAKISSQSPAKVDEDMESIKEESSDSKRLKRIEERLREMNLWWNEVMQEQAEEDEGFVYGNNGVAEEKCRSKIEETVGVERVEESLILRFSCPCSKIYKILLTGNSCFYKLA